MDTAYFNAAMNGIDQAFQGREYDTSLIAAQALEASLRAERRADPEQLGWARYYAFRNLYTIGACWEGYRLLITDTDSWCVSPRCAAWMASAGAELAAELGMVDESLQLLVRALELRLAGGDEEGAREVCEVAAALLGGQAQLVDFVEVLEGLVAAAPPGSDEALLRAMLCSEVASQDGFLAALPSAERRRRALARALRDAALAGDMEALERALAEGAEPSAAVLNAPGLPTALLAAAFEGHTAVVERLLAAGAELECADVQGRTALIRAAEQGHVEVIRVLCEAGAKLDAADSQGMSALHVASRRGHREAVATLLLAGAPLEARDSCGGTPLAVAVTEDVPQVIQLLLEAGAELESRDDFGQTPLISAAIAGQARVVCQLLAWGADLSARDRGGLSALDWARLAGNLSTAAALVA